jgi:hypothetical protein
MKVRATDSTGDHAKSNLSASRLWNLALDGDERT